MCFSISGNFHEYLILISLISFRSENNPDQATLLRENKIGIREVSSSLIPILKFSI
jgi:hypothetical protein